METLVNYSIHDDSDLDEMTTEAYQTVPLPSMQRVLRNIQPCSPPLIDFTPERGGKLFLCSTSNKKKLPNSLCPFSPVLNEVIQPNEDLRRRSSRQRNAPISYKDSTPNTTQEMVEQFVPPGIKKGKRFVRITEPVATTAVNVSSDISLQSIFTPEEFDLNNSISTDSKSSVESRRTRSRRRSSFKLPVRRRANGQRAPPKKTPQVICPECKQIFVSRYGVMNHYQRVHEKCLYTCPFCPTKHKGMKRLQDHARNVRCYERFEHHEESLEMDSFV